MRASSTFPALAVYGASLEVSRCRVRVARNLQSSRSQVMVGIYPFNNRPFRPQCKMDADTAKETWRSLSTAVSKIYEKNASELSFEELYRCRQLTSLIHMLHFRNAYNLVLHKHGDLLYNGIQEMIKARLRAVRISLARNVLMIILR